ncbi:Anthocyanidin 3-O-glucosyltransferase [Euphorbia peplus]|nr:Anthocyanidin 3-O-glucosyltransferase [Euphorbia peplus]
MRSPGGTAAAGKHVAAIAFPYTSHPIVLFNLMHRLAMAAPNIQFSFLSIAKSNSSILSDQSSSVPVNIRNYNMEEVNVPEGSDLIMEMNSFIEEAPGIIKRSIDEAEVDSGKKITCLITDLTFSFAVGEIAKERNIPWIALWVPAPCSLPAFFHLDLLRHKYDNIDHIHNQITDRVLDIIPGLPPISFADLPMLEFSGLVEKESIGPIRSVCSSMTRTIHEASVVVMNSYNELNPVLLIDYFNSKFQNLLFIGALTLSESSKEDVTGCLPWLDRQKPSSVVYICCGTGVGLPPEEITSLAEALESRNTPFLWSMKDELKDHLPSGFLDKTNGKVVSWAPQSQILKHPSVGVYVTHCGFNSVFESIVGGVPMICRSVWIDNHINAKMVEEVWEIGVRVNDGGKITKDGMMKSLEIIFENDQGKKIKENVNGLKHALIKAAGPDGVAGSDFKTLVQVIS